MGDDSLGIHHHCRGELASIDLDLSCFGLPVVSPECRRTSSRQPDAPCRKRGSIVPPAPERYEARGPQLAGGSSVRPPSIERRVCGLGCGAQEPALHLLLLSCAVGLWLVCAKAQLAPLPGDSCVVCHGADVEADGDHAALRPVAARLLAVGKNSGGATNRAARSAVDSAGSADKTIPRKSALARALRSQRLGHDVCATGWRRSPFSGAVSAWDTPGESHCCLRCISLENDLAGPSGCALSPCRRFASGLASWVGSSGLARDQCFGPTLSFTTISAHRLAMVSGHADSRHRTRAGGLSVDGRPLYLHSFDRSVRNVGMGDGGAG